MSIEPPVDGRLPKSSLRHFISWWMGELDGLFRQLKFGSRPWKTLLYRTRDCMDVYIREAGVSKHIASFSDGERRPGNVDDLPEMKIQKLAKGNIVLRLSSQLALRREVKLPAAIVDVIEPVLKNQVEQLVPWPAEQTSFGFELDDRKRTDSNIVVRLAAIRQSNVEDALSQASKLGFEPRRIEIADGTEQVSGLELRNHRKYKTPRSVGHLAIVLVSLFALSMTVGITGFWQMLNTQSKLGQANKKLAIVTLNNSRIGEARVTNAELIRQRNWLIGKRKQTPPIAIIMDALTRLLPDDAQLTRFEMTDNKIIITGRTSNAAELIGRLEQSAHFKSVRFYSPTLRKSNDAKEIFAIEVELERGRDRGGQG